MQVSTLAATSNTAAVAALMPVTEILCRYDQEKNKPVVFVPRNMEGGMIESWITGTSTEMVPLSNYHNTLPLSAADEVLLRNRFAKATGDKNVQIRHRLPRQVKEVPNRLARSIVAAPVPAAPAAATPVPAPAPAAVAPAPVAAPAVTSRKRKGQKGIRRPAAKPIASAPANAGVEAAPADNRAMTMRRATDNVQEVPTLEAKVDQLAAVVAALAETMGVKVEAGK